MLYPIELWVQPKRAKPTNRTRPAQAISPARPGAFRRLMSQRRRNFAGPSHDWFLSRDGQPQGRDFLRARLQRVTLQHVVLAQLAFQCLIKQLVFPVRAQSSITSSADALFGTCRLVHKPNSCGRDPGRCVRTRISRRSSHDRMVCRRVWPIKLDASLL